MRFGGVIGRAHVGCNGEFCHERDNIQKSYVHPYVDVRVDMKSTRVIQENVL